MSRHIKWGVIGLAVVTGLVWLVDALGLVTTSSVIRPQRIHRDTGFAFTVSVDVYDTRGLFVERTVSAWSSSVRPVLRLFEDGAPLGPAGASLTRVRTVGGGAYTQRGPTLFFSSSDNADARANGRAYVATYPLHIRSWFKLALVGLTGLLCGVWLWTMGPDARRALGARILAGGRRVHERCERWPYTQAVSLAVLAAGIAAANYVVLQGTRMLPCLEPDSSGYLGSSVMRSAGYPLFLHGVIETFGHVRWVVPLQLNLLLASFLLLAWAVARASRSRLAGVAVGLSLILAKPLLAPSWTILSEALFTPLLCAHAAAVLILLRTKSAAAALAVGVTMGLAISVRPAGYSLLVGLPILPWIVRTEWKRIGGVLCGGLVVVLLASALGQYWRSGHVTAHSLGGLALVGHVAPIVTGDLDTAYPALTRRIANRIAPIVQGLEDLSFPREHWQRTTRTYNTLLWGHIVPEINAHLHAEQPHLSDHEQTAQLNAIALHIATAAILHRPAWYVKHAAAHYLGLWHTFGQDLELLSYQIALCQGRTRQLLKSQPEAFGPLFDPAWYHEGTASLRSAERSFADWLDLTWDPVPFFCGPCVLTVFAAGVLGVVGLVTNRVRSSWGQALAYIGILIHGNLAFVASVQAGLVRYAQPLRPLVIVMLVGIAMAVMGWVIRRIQGGARDHLGHAERLAGSQRANP